jgi:hypothetical protein
VIIWGTRTKREGRGFIFKPCPSCRSDQVHFAAETKTKFTLYFVPTFTTSTKALLICTRCERQEEFDGAQAQSYLQAARPSDQLVADLRRRQVGNADGEQEAFGQSQTPSPIHSLAIGMVVLAMQVALADGTIDDAETTAIGRAFATIHSATKAEPVKQAAGLVVAEMLDILAWINAPTTGPVALMLAGTGRELRQLEPVDRSRYIGQVAWLCETVAAASGGTSEAKLEPMDSGIAMMGFSPQEVAEALAFCDQSGG